MLPALLTPISSVIALGVTAITLSGCSATTAYPDDWASLVAPASSACVELSGVFANRGRRVQSRRVLGNVVEGAHYTDDDLLQGYLYDTTPSSLAQAEVTHIAIDGRTGGQLAIEYYSSSRRLLADSMPCIGGKAVRVGEVNAGGGAFGRSRIAFQFQRAVDGALIVGTSRDTEAVSVVLVPVVEHATWWSRFESFEPDSEP